MKKLYAIRALMRLRPRSQSDLWDEKGKEPAAAEKQSRRFTDWISSDAGIGTIGDPIVAAMRLVLVSAALLSIHLDQSAPDRYVSLAYGALMLYALYSVTAFVLAVRNSPLARSAGRWSHWIDVGAWTALIVLAGGADSHFFFIYFFPVLVASLRYGFLSGALTTIASAILYTVVAYVPSPQDEGSLHSLHRPIYLVALGLVMAYWGGHEVSSRRKLTLLRDVRNFSNPRFGIGRTTAGIMERLRAFYDADSCLLITQQTEGGDTYSLRRAGRRVAEEGSKARAIDPTLAQQLIAAPAGCALLYRAPGRLRRRGRFYSYDPKTSERKSQEPEEGEALTNLLDARSFVAVPMYPRWGLIGQIYLTSARRNAFAISDIDFILRIRDEVVPVIENIQVVGYLASKAAERERERMARNVHDNAVQLYVGLQAGLTSLRQKLDAALAEGEGNPAQLLETVSGAVGTVDRLIEITGITAGDLRGQMIDLKDASGREHVLLSSIRRLAADFSAVTGVAVSVKGDLGVRLNDRLVAELYQMAVEGLSNIRRHTRAKQALIAIECSGDYLTLQIENDDASEQQFVQFTPRSIAGRAEALGGRWRVERNAMDRTVVTVEVPL